MQNFVAKNARLHQQIECCCERALRCDNFISAAAEMEGIFLQQQINFAATELSLVFAAAEVVANLNMLKSHVASQS